MTTLRLKPKRGGFLRPFGCGWFIREFLAGNAPYGSPVIVPSTGAPQADIFYHYKEALRQVSAMDKATRSETKQAIEEKRPIDPDNINSLYQRYLARIPYKANGCRYHSFVTYFSNLQRLGWVEPSGKVEPVLGNMKWNRRRIMMSLRGLEKVRGEFSLMCLVHNVKKVVKGVLAGSVNLPDKYSGLAHMATLRYREEVPIFVPS